MTTATIPTTAAVTSSGATVPDPMFAYKVGIVCNAKALALGKTAESIDTDLNTQQTVLRTLYKQWKESGASAKTQTILDTEREIMLLSLAASEKRFRASAVGVVLGSVQDAGTKVAVRAVQSMGWVAEKTQELRANSMAKAYDAQMARLQGLGVMVEAPQMSNEHTFSDVFGSTKKSFYTRLF